MKLKNHTNSKLNIAILNCLLPFLINYIVFIYFLYKPIYIKFDIIILNFIFQFILYNINFFPSRVVLFFWYFNYLIGIIFINNAVINDYKYNVFNNKAEVFYFLCMISLSFGIYIYDWKSISFKNYNYKLKNDINSITKYCLIIFPFLFFFSIIYNLGFIPILSGNIVDEMYSYKFGYLYGFKIVLILSSLFLFYRIVVDKTNIKINILLIILFFIISLVDGRRVVGLYILIGFIIFYYFILKKTIPNFFLFNTFIFISFIYIFFNFLRSNTFTDLNFNTFINNLPIGVEFADYVYSFNNLNSYDLKNYNLIASSLGSFLNSSLLSFFGYNKANLLSSGSESVWMNVYGINQGVRTGIVNELYFTFGEVTIGIFFFIGIFLNYFSIKILMQKKLFTLILLTSIYILIFFLIVGQSTVFWGTISTLLYLYLFHKFISKIFYK
jgi:hypothetical protein